MKMEWIEVEWSGFDDRYKYRKKMVKGTSKNHREESKVKVKLGKIIC